MGNHRRRRAEFFAEHPMCCFCGGGAAATEEDHIPARSLFLRRQWPMGYAFPACGPCNRASADDELAMAWLVRIAISDFTAEEEQELSRALTQLHDRHPDWVAGMRALNRVETRRHLRERGLTLDDFRGFDLGVITMPDELVKVPERYGAKIGKALYYRHTSRVLPNSGQVIVHVYPNADYLAATFPTDNFEFLTGRPVLTRSGKSLESQFSYRFAAVSEGGAAAFLVQFGESLVMVLLAVEDAAQYAALRAAHQAEQASAPASP